MVDVHRVQIIDRDTCHEMHSVYIPVHFVLPRLEQYPIGQDRIDHALTISVLC